MSALRSYVPSAYRPLGESWLLEWAPAPPRTARPVLHVPVPSPDRLITSPARLSELLAGQRLIEPSMFIFHVSHCGSTLLARLLAVDPDLHVSIEPHHLGQFLALSYGAPAERFARHAAPMIRICGLGSDASRLVIKWTSHALYRVGDIRRLYPDVPAVLVYRDPFAVWSRLQAGPIGFLDDRRDWSLELLGLTPSAGTVTAQELRVAYIERMFERAAEHAHLFDRLVNYSELPDAVHDVRARIAGAAENLDAAELRRVAGRYSKQPNRPYTGDVTAGVAAPRLSAESSRRLSECYRALETRRCAALASPSVAPVS
jgi:hypothetical protein